MYASIFVVALSAGSYNPLVPLYAQELGASYMDLGLIGAAFSLPYVALPILVGTLSDRFDRRCFYFFGISCCAVTAILFNLASNVSHLIAVRLLGGVAYAFMWPPAEALIVDFTTAEERTKAMGRYGFSWASGFLIGPPVGGLIVEKFNFYTLFTSASVIGVAATLVALFGMIRLRRPKPLKQTYRTGGRLLKPVSSFLPLCVIVVTYSIALGLVFSIFPAYASNLGVTSIQVGILFAALGVVRTLTFLQSEAISKMGVKQALSLALMVQAASLATIAYFTGFPYFVVIMALLGLAIGIFSPLTLSTASKMASKDRAGMTVGLVETLFGTGMTVGPLVGGMAAETLGATSPYLIIATLSGLSVIPLAAWRRKII